MTALKIHWNTTFTANWGILSSYEHNLWRFFWPLSGKKKKPNPHPFEKVDSDLGSWDLFNNHYKNGWKIRSGYMVLWLTTTLIFTGFCQFPAFASSFWQNRPLVKIDSFNEHYKKNHKIRWQDHVVIHLTTAITYNCNSGFIYDHKSRTTCNWVAFGIGTESFHYFWLKSSDPPEQWNRPLHLKVKKKCGWRITGHEYFRYLQQKH